jgi:uncharacterized membrane protein YhaH (DUF805 family)
MELRRAGRRSGTKKLIFLAPAGRISRLQYFGFPPPLFVVFLVRVAALFHHAAAAGRDGEELELMEGAPALVFLRPAAAVSVRRLPASIVPDGAIFCRLFLLSTLSASS